MKFIIPTRDKKNTHFILKLVSMQIAPGEPVPPGFENEVKAVAEIQSKIDKCKNLPFIGLEYLLELSMRDNKEPGYLCVLCEKRGDPRTIMDHLTSYKHYLKYLVKFSNSFLHYICSRRQRCKGIYHNFLTSVSNYNK